MEFQTDLQSWLNHFCCPAFAVKEHRICACNQAAEALLLAPGADVRPLLMTGAEQYETFQEGCLYLKLKLAPGGNGACVTSAGEQLLFLLDQIPEDPELKSLALAARELRSPLSNMIIASDMLRSFHQDDPAIQEQLARLSRSLQQMHRLINNMSDAGRSDLLTPTGVHEWNSLFRNIFEKIQTQLEDTPVTLEYEGLREPVYGVANEGQLERAVLNIVSNSMKFMRDGGQIQAKLTRQKDMLQLSILDSGSGIAENILSQLFRRYRRQPGIEDSRFGLGLGMVLIRSAAADHGGTVLIDQPGEAGTRVTMTFAIRQEASRLSSPVTAPLVESSSQILTELSDCLPWEFYK